MDVIVDGERNYALQGEPSDVLSAVAAVDRYLQERGRAITSVTLDGEPVTPETIVEKLGGRGLDDVAVLEVGSREVVELVEQSLSELRSALPDLPDACRRLAQVFHGEVPEDGYEPFRELADIWRHVKQRELRIASALGLDLDGLMLEGKSVAAMHQELNTFLEEAAQALETGDCVLLGDLLEYELAPRAEREAEIAALLQSQAPAKSG